MVSIWESTEFALTKETNFNKKRDKNSKKFIFPKNCPSCNNKTIKDILGKNFDQTLKKTKKPGFQLFRFMAQIKSLSLKI